MSVVIPSEKSVCLNFKDKPVEIYSSQIPVFTTTSIPIIRELNKGSPYYASLKSGLDLKTKISTLAKKIEAFTAAKDNKTRNCIFGVLRGIIFVATVAATVFAGILTFGAAGAAAASGIPAAFIFGTIASLGIALWNVNKSLEVHHWPHLFMALFLAPFTPTYYAFANISRLEKETSHEKAENEKLVKSLCEYYSNDDNTQKIKGSIAQRIQELKNASQAINEDTETKTFLSNKIAAYTLALQEFDASVSYFSNLAKSAI